MSDRELLLFFPALGVCKSSENMLSGLLFFMQPENAPQNKRFTIAKYIKTRGHDAIFIIAVCFFTE